MSSAIFWPFCSGLSVLTYLPSFCKQHFQVQFFIWESSYFKQIPLNFVAKGSVHKSTLVQLMAGYHIDGKPLLEPKMT